MLAEIERGADAVGGIPSTALKGAGLLPHIRATVKLPMIVMKRTLQQPSAAHRLSSAVPAGCSVLMYCVSSVSRIVLKSKTLISPGRWWQTATVFGRRIAASYTHRNVTVRVRRRRWRRWIVGYAVCMRLHKRLLFSRFGIFSIFPMLLVVLYGVGIYLTTWFNEFITTGPHGVVLAMFPLIWVGVVCVIGAFSAWFHRCWLLVPLAPLSVVCIISLCHLDYLWTYCLFT